MSSRSVSSRSSSTSSSSSSSSSLSAISNSLNIITNEINSLSLIATSLTQEPVRKRAPVDSNHTGDEETDKTEAEDEKKPKSSRANRRVIRSLLKLIRPRSRKKLKTASSLNNLASAGGKTRKTGVNRYQSKSIGNLAEPDLGQKTKSKNPSTRRRFRLIKQNSKKNQSFSVSGANNASNNNNKSLTSSSIYSSADLNSSDGSRSTKTKSNQESFRLSRMSSKELSWYRLEELDYYYKILGTCLRSFNTTHMS